MQANQLQALIYELRIRFERKPRKCRKVNDSYIGYAQRIVCINNNTFYYYPTIQQFQDLDFDKLQYVIPKAGVKLTQIIQLKFPPRRTNERNFFSIMIPKNKILKFTKGMKQIIVDQYAQGQQTWTFNFPFDIIALPQRQQKQKQALEKQRLKQKKLLEQLERLKQLQEKQAKQKMKEQYNALVQAEQMNNGQEDQEYMKKRKQLNLKQNRQKRIKQNDQLFFTRNFNKLIAMSGGGNGIDAQVEAEITKIANQQLQLLKTIGNFRQRAQLTVRQFIDQWPYTIDKQIKKNFYYKINNLNIKIGDKNLNQQFLSNTCVASAILRCRNDLSKGVRVPLTAFVKYKGFKVFVRAGTIIDECNPADIDSMIVHGNCVDNWLSSFIIIDNLNTITDNLKLKPYTAQVHYQRVQLHLGSNVKVFQTQIDPYKQIKKLDPTLRQAYNNYKLNYIYDIDQVLPIDLDLQQNINQSNIRLRPQFVGKYVDPLLKVSRLVGGSLLYSLEDQQGQKDDVIVAKAAQHFKFVWLYNFVKALNNLKMIPYNSQSLGEIMKTNGINMRYLGTIFKTTQLPYIKSITQIQCISRIVKNIYRQYQQQYCTVSFKQDPQARILIHDAFSKKSSAPLRKIRLKQIKKLQSQKAINNAIDFLNLIFGSGEQTLTFWKIIQDKVHDYYKIQIRDYMSLPHGYLLKSILYNCGFQVKITQKTILFLTQKPFKQSDWMKFLCKVQSFDLPDLNVYSKIDQKQTYSFQKNKHHLQLKLLIRRALRKKQLDVLIELTKYKQNFQPARQQFTIQSLFYFMMHPTPQNFDNALKIAHFILPPSHPFFIQIYLTYSKLKTSKLDVVSLKKAAQNHSIRNLGIKHWKTAQILYNFNQVQYLNNLKQAQIGVSPQNRSKLYLSIIKQLIHLGRLQDCSSYLRKSIQTFGSIKLNETDQLNYFEILLLGMQANYRMRRIQNLVKISEYMWAALQKYWITPSFNNRQNNNGDYLGWFEQLLKMVVKCFLQSYYKKHYLYKLVLILREQLKYSQQSLDKYYTLNQIFIKSKQAKNHVNWIKQLLIKLQFGYLQLNFKNDFFSGFWKYTKQFSNEDFQEGLKQIHDLLFILGEQYFFFALEGRIYSFEKGVQVFQVPVNLNLNNNTTKSIMKV